MPNEQILTTIICGGTENTRLEVVLGPNSSSGRMLELRRLSWGEGVGWYCQQTLRLDSKEAENLLQTLRQSQFKWRDRPESRRGKIIPFPVSRTSHEEPRTHSWRDVQEKQSNRSAAALSGGEKRGIKRGKEKSVTSRV